MGRHQCRGTWCRNNGLCPKLRYGTKNGLQSPALDLRRLLKLRKLGLVLLQHQGQQAIQQGSRSLLLLLLLLLLWHRVLDQTNGSRCGLLLSPARWKLPTVLRWEHRCGSIFLLRWDAAIELVASFPTRMPVTPSQMPLAMRHNSVPPWPKWGRVSRVTCASLLGPVLVVVVVVLAVSEVRVIVFPAVTTIRWMRLPIDPFEDLLRIAAVVTPPFVVVVGWKLVPPAGPFAASCAAPPPAPFPACSSARSSAPVPAP